MSFCVRSRLYWFLFTPVLADLSGFGFMVVLSSEKVFPPDKQIKNTVGVQWRWLKEVWQPQQTYMYVYDF